MRKGKILAYAWLTSVIAAVTYSVIKHGMFEEFAIGLAAAMAIVVTILSLAEVLSDY